jgi:hypothetical protein
MNLNCNTKWCMLTALVAVGTTIGLNQYAAAQQPQPPPQPRPPEAASAGEDGVEVLTRGPVHEAFAETITFDPEPGIVAPEVPPADIEEVPPQQRPAGKNLAWIPGYWAWDDERNDFLWLSGIWRALPPGRQWVPGYWGQSQLTTGESPWRQGAQWTSGYWADAAASEIEYLPEPPATVEVGPNIAAPSADDIWLPGCWVWQQNRYAWRPGYWTKGHQDWDWVPDHYVWTPSGYVFVDGYYDHSVPRRGVVFAPVYFHGGLRTQHDFSYSPSTVINPAVFVSHLFLRPRYGHYYFGDYYGANYADAGYSPWFSYHSSRHGYDPIYANQRWQHRRDRGWEQRAQTNFRNLRDNENDRPPRNWEAQRERTRHGDKANSRIAVAERFEELTQRPEVRPQFQAVEPAERQQFGQRRQEYRKYLQQRQKLEADAARPRSGDPATATAARRRFSRSPVVAPPADQLGKENAPPRRHQVLKPDLQVQPKPRVRDGRPAARQALRPGAAGAPAARNRATPQAQPERQRANRGNRQGASAGEAQNQQNRRANRRQAQSQGTPNTKSQDAPRNQPKRESRKKDKD